MMLARHLAFKTPQKAEIPWDFQGSSAVLVRHVGDDSVCFLTIIDSSISRDNSGGGPRLNPRYLPLLPLYLMISERSWVAAIHGGDQNSIKVGSEGFGVG